ncbi:MAG: trypsin-like peptidase domain-containing protein [Clostridia bacterium]|nr:trypsin-like peptidase domain-containing protein [Clostridia bacterium]
MDYYNENGYTYTQPVKTKKSALPAICVILCILLILSLASTAVVTFLYLNNSANAQSMEDIRQDIYDEINDQYSSEIQELNSTIELLQTNLAKTSQQESINIISQLDELTSPVVAIASAVRPSIVGIKVVIPSSKIISGFFWYETGDSESTGSGIILTADGYIATNYHVVSYYDEYDDVIISVILDDGTELEAELIGGDKANDLAVIKADTKGLELPAATLGSSEDLNVGEVVVAIGNPLGTQFAGTVTMGIISALDRSISSENTAETLIQTDAAINPGNSGGALINSQGQIIGITSSKIADTDVEGLGFAIPIDFAKPIIEDIIQYGYVKDRPATGISGQAVSSAMARYYGLPQGVMVTAVDNNSGADIAGIEEYDIITEIDGKTITSMSDIQSINETHSVGDIIQVTFYRNRQYQTVNLKLLEDRGR